MQAYNTSRMRRSPLMRDLVRETRLTRDDLVMPLFFCEGRRSKPIRSMPGIEKMPHDLLLREVERLRKSGIKAVILFGADSRKTEGGESSYDDESPFHKAIRAVKKSCDIMLITDVCICSYTSHGHCGVPGPQARKLAKSQVMIDGEKTLEALSKAALSQAGAGADMVAPSAMASGQVRAIRERLDAGGFPDTAIMGYSAKFASSFYGPFRDIYDSAPVFGDRRGYQMDPCNNREAVREAMIDEEEGADIVMVKPALAYLDIIRDVRASVSVPVAAYNVSGEYSMVKAAADKGWLDERQAACEILDSIKRAGADLIITYWAKEAAAWIGSRG